MHIDPRLHPPSAPRPVADIVAELQSLRDGHAAAHLLKDTSAERRITRGRLELEDAAHQSEATR